MTLVMLAPPVCSVTVAVKLPASPSWFAKVPAVAACTSLTTTELLSSVMPSIFRISPNAQAARLLSSLASVIETVKESGKLSTSSLTTGAMRIWGYIRSIG